MLKTLIKKQLLEIWQGYFIDRKTGKMRSKKGIAMFFLLFALLFLGLGAAFYVMAGSIGDVALGNGLNWLYFALTGLIAMALGVFGSVFNTYASVYLPKDNELLMSLPIPGRTLLTARLIGVYVTSLMYSAWVWIPVMIRYWVTVPVNVPNVVFPVILTFVITLFVTVLSCILGWLVALIAAKTKGKSFITLFFSIAIFAIYYVVYFKIIGSLGEIANHVDKLGDTVRSWMHYSYRLGLAADGDLISMLIVTGVTLILGAACFLVLSRSFTKLSTVSESGGKKPKAPADYTARTAKKALLRREYKHFSSVATWMLNGGFGLLLLPIAAAALLIKSGSIRAFMPEIAAEMPELYAMLPALLAVAVCFIMSTNAILPVSVSIEGKTVWQLQSLPIEPWAVLRAKESMSVQLCAYPAVIFVLICGMVFKLNWLDIGLICAAVCLFVWLISDFGLFLNLKMPNLNWTNVAVLTKQSMPAIISMFGGWIFCAALGVGGFFLARTVSIRLVLCAYILLFLALWLILHNWLKKKGTAIFASL